MARQIPPLIHVRAAGRPSAVPGEADVSARTMAVDALRRELQSGGLPRDTEVLFAGLGDWTAASEIPELWVAPGPEPVATAAQDPVDDPGAPSIPVSSTTSDGPRRRGFGAMAIVGAVLAAIGLLGVGAIAIYFVFFHYKPVAVQHLPRRCVVATRVDLFDIAFFDPIINKLAPAIEEATRPPPPPGVPPPAGPSLKERLKVQANVNVDRDIREIAACVFNDTTLPSGVKDDFAGYRAVIAVGGRFRTGSIPGLFEALRPELAPFSPRLEGAGEAAVIRLTIPTKGSGVALLVGQAEDGTLLIAPNDAALASAREQRTEDEAHASTGLKQQGSVELAIDHFLFGVLFGYTTPPTGYENIFKSLGNVKDAHVAITLTKSPKVEVSLDQKTEGAAKDTETALRRLVEMANHELSSIPKDWAGEHAALGGTRINRDDTRVDVKIDFRYPDLDRGAQELSEQIKDPASVFRTKSWPVLAWRIGVGPKPPAAGSASGAAPLTPPPLPPPPDEEGDD
jgi:hypothetical protein